MYDVYGCVANLSSFLHDLHSIAARSFYTANSADFVNAVWMHLAVREMGLVDAAYLEKLTPHLAVLTRGLI